MIVIAVVSGNPVCNQNEKFLRSPCLYCTISIKKSPLESSSFFLWNCLYLNSPFLGFYVCFYIWSIFFIEFCLQSWVSKNVTVLFGGRGAQQYWRLLAWEIVGQESQYPYCSGWEVEFMDTAVYVTRYWDCGKALQFTVSFSLSVCVYCVREHALFFGLSCFLAVLLYICFLAL